MTDPKKELRHLLRDFKMGMLVSHQADGPLHARPMVMAGVDDDGDLWFVTSREMPKVDEILQDPHVAVTMQSDDAWVAISGEAVVVDDRGKLQELWKEGFRAWFPKGKDDPSLVLLHVRSREGEYWEMGGVDRLKYLIQAGRAYVKGDRPHVEPGQHGQVRF